MKRKFKNMENGNVFFDVHSDGVLRCVHSKITYTTEEAEKCTELTEIIDKKY